MIIIKRTNYDFATIDATEEEWDAFEKIVAFIVNDYVATENEYMTTDIDYMISGHADTRKNKFLSFAEGFAMIEDRSDKFHRYDIDLLLTACSAVDDTDVPGVSQQMRSSIVEQVYKLRIVDIFNDDITPRENLEL